MRWRACRQKRSRRRCLGPSCEEDPKKLAAFLDGFSLQAGTHVHERDRDRDGLEHLLRYALRPPLSLERLTRSGDGRVVLSLRSPLHDGTTAVAFSPMELLKRLAAIVPPEDPGADPQYPD